MIYQVTSWLFPMGFPEASTKLVTNKRFSDFQKLHKALNQIHKNLHLTGKPLAFKYVLSPYNCVLQRVPALRAFWDLEKTVLHEIRVSGTVLWSPTNANSPTYTYISQKPC